MLTFAKYIPKKIVIFASGSGTNAENIIKYFQSSDSAQVAAVFSNKRTAGVLSRAEALQVRTITFNREEFYETAQVLEQINALKPDLIVLAGFLWLFPENIIKAYPNRVINLHPALLPKYGGKGMYGMHVHRAVLEQKEVETGISIHYVNEKFDEGEIIFKATTPVNPFDTPEEILKRVHELEYEYFPRVIEEILTTSEND